MTTLVCIHLSGRPFEREAAQVLAATIKANWGMASYTFENMKDLQELSAQSDYIVVLTPFTIVRGLRDTLNDLIAAPFEKDLMVAGIPAVLPNGREAFAPHIDSEAHERMAAINVKYIRTDCLVFKSQWINEKPVNHGLSFVDDLNTRFTTSLIVPNRLSNTPDLHTYSVTSTQDLTRQREVAFSSPVLCMVPAGRCITKEYDAAYEIQFPWECYDYFVKHFSDSEEFKALVAKKVDAKVSTLFSLKRKIQAVK